GPARRRTGSRVEEKMKPRFPTFLLSALALGGSLAAALGQPSLSRFPYNGDNQATAQPAKPERLGGQGIHPAADLGLDPAAPEVTPDPPPQPVSRSPSAAEEAPPAAPAVIKIGEGPAPRPARAARVAPAQESPPLDSLSAPPPPVPTSKNMTPTLKTPDQP